MPTISTTFDILAALCSLLPKEKERECSIKWKTTAKEIINAFLQKYKNFIAIILNSSADEYNLNDKEIAYVTGILHSLSTATESSYDDIYLLSIAVEEKINTYSDWQCHGMIYCIKPLNSNYEETGISIYPYFSPQWNTQKSDRHRAHTLNAHFKNYMMIRKTDASPFEIIMHYWNDKGLLKGTEHGWKLKVAVTPVMNYAALNTRNSDSGILVKGIINEAEVEARILQIFDSVFEKQYNLIIFPEALGSKTLIDKIKQRMHRFPEYCSFVLLPTVYENGHNVLTILGPGGIEILRENKVTPFILRDQKQHCLQEELCFTNQVHILITKELGYMAFPICADLLDPDYYSLLSNTVQVNTILCPSFSPGMNAFRNTIVKGISSMMLSIWINSCSAQSVSNNGTVPETLGIIQLPDSNSLETIEKSCDGNCFSKKICYYDFTICYEHQIFTIEHTQWKCA